MLHNYENNHAMTVYNRVMTLTNIMLQARHIKIYTVLFQLYEV